MMKPVSKLLEGGRRLHLQHGPIDLIVGVDPVEPAGRLSVFDAATKRFETILTELVSELPLLRETMTNQSEEPVGLVAKRMDMVVRPYANSQFLTRMAAVAGSVADEVLFAMIQNTNLQRAYVNNGGDIAFYLSDNTEFSIAMAGLDGSNLGEIKIKSDTDIRGIATSGQAGRSFSLGIADSVTVLAKTAAEADIAATLIANSVTLEDHPHIHREKACNLDPDSDLGNRKVVTSIGDLSSFDINKALDAGYCTAAKMIRDNLIFDAALSLKGIQRLVGASSTNRLIKIGNSEICLN